MQEAIVEYRRRKLSQVYAFPTERRARALGYVPTCQPGHRAPIQRLLTRVRYQFLPHYWGQPPKWRVLARAVSGGRRTLPDFYVVGPMKSATSDLAVNLLLHPNLMLPLVKELSGRHPELWRAYYPTRRQKRRYAERHGLALSPYLGPFLDDMELPYHICRVQPGAKVVISLRNPAQRVFSHWKWECFLSGARRAARLLFLVDFRLFVDTSLDMFANGRMYTACGSDALSTSIYWRSVKRWINYFGADNVRVMGVEKYFLDRESYLNDIYAFVGLPRVNGLPSMTRINDNPLVFPPPDEVSMDKLRRFFEPYNDKLWTVIGKRFDW